jgi:hypothetical protein
VLRWRGGFVNKRETAVAAKDGIMAFAGRMIAGYFAQPQDRPPLCAPPRPYNGPRLDLRDVTLVIIEPMLHDLAREAALDTLRHAAYGDVLVFSDRRIDIPGAEWRPTERGPDQDSVTGLFLYGDWLDGVATKFVQLLHWDSWIVDPALWVPAFLDYDYIGAPWGYTDGLNVGCGAFALRSVALMRYLAQHRDAYPLLAGREDDLLCRRHRPALEKQGFTWAPENLAVQFCFECARVSLWPSRHFGFHEFRNWPLVLGREPLIERVKLAMRSDYIRRSGKLDQILRCAPWLREPVGA